MSESTSRQTDKSRPPSDTLTPRRPDTLTRRLLRPKGHPICQPITVPTTPGLSGGARMVRFSSGTAETSANGGALAGPRKWTLKGLHFRTEGGLTDLKGGLL